MVQSAGGSGDGSQKQARGGGLGGGTAVINKKETLAPDLLEVTFTGGLTWRTGGGKVGKYEE